MIKAIHLVLPAPKQRRHQALFNRDLPFRGRVEKSKTVYCRKPKHPARNDS